MNQSFHEDECIECRATAARARRLAARIRCRCGAELIPPVRTDEALLQRLLDASEQMARWAPYFQGSAIDYDRRREPERLLTPSEREQLDARNERARAGARGLFVRLEQLRTEAARTRGPELQRAVAVIDWLVERCGSERTRGHRVGGEVIAPKLSRSATCLPRSSTSTLSGSLTGTLLMPGYRDRRRSAPARQRQA